MAAIGEIRKRMGGVLIFVMILGIGGFLLMDTLQSSSSVATNRKQYIVEINGTKIDYNFYRSRYDQNIQYYKDDYGVVSLSEDVNNSIRNQTYNEIVLEFLLDEKYRELGIQVSDDEFNDMIRGQNIHPQIASFFTNPETGVFDPNLRDSYLTNLNVDPPGVAPGSRKNLWLRIENIILKDRIANKYFSLLENGVTVPSWLAEVQYANEQTNVAINYIQFPYNEIADSSISVSADEVKKYAKKHKEAFSNDRTRTVRYVTFPVAPSSQDIYAAETWITEKTEEWKTGEESDSLFVRLYSEDNWTQEYIRESELPVFIRDSVEDASLGAVWGPFEDNNEYISYKLIHRKSVPDSVKVRQIYLSGENISSQEEAIALGQLADSLLSLIDSQGVSMESLVSRFSDDLETLATNGDAGWVRPDELLEDEKNALFFSMNAGDTRLFYQQNGIFIKQVYQQSALYDGIRLATLRRSVLPSSETERNTYAEASLFSGNHSTKEKFDEAVKDRIARSVVLDPETYNVSGLEGSGRKLVQWAFSADINQVSSPERIGDQYVVAVLEEATQEGELDLDNESIYFQIENRIRNEKKAAQYIEMLATSTSNTLDDYSTEYNKDILSETGISFNNTYLSSIASNEPSVAGTALVIEPNVVSNPVVGEQGVFLVETGSTSDISTPLADVMGYRNRIQREYVGSVLRSINNTIVEDADIEDKRLDYF